MKHFSASRKGTKHAENQDSFGCRSFPGTDVKLLVVADGISSHLMGGSVARWVIEKRLMQDEITFGSDLYLNFKCYLHAMHQCLSSDFDGLTPLLQSGCSLSLALVTHDIAHIFWAGDTPIFQVPKGRLPVKLNEPHLSPSGKLTKFFAANRQLELNYLQFPLDHDDLLIIGSDGAQLTDLLITELIGIHGVTQEFVDNAICEAAIRPHSDDATMIVYQHSRI